jgi:hypothetical protein
MKSFIASFFKGGIYSTKWITDSLKARKLLSKEDFLITLNNDDDSRVLEVPRNAKFTIAEGMKIYEIASQQKEMSLTSTVFWLKIQ